MESIEIIPLLVTVPLSRLAPDLKKRECHDEPDSLFRNKRSFHDIGEMLLVHLYTAL